MKRTYEVIGSPAVEPTQIIVADRAAIGWPYDESEAILIACHPSRKQVVQDALRQVKENEAEFDRMLDLINAMLSSGGKAT